ncbi:MAG: DsrE family protein [Chloroflexi bacterium]|nr:DsrE family protein [Chloroflexota bacterium]
MTEDNDDAIIYREEMKLAIELMTGVGAEDVHTVKRIAEAALRQQHEVAIFLMGDGVYHFHRLKDLAHKGVRVTMCTQNAYERKVDPGDDALSGSQYDWAHIVHDADRVIVFG